MSERLRLLASISMATRDYREGEIDSPTPEHVDRWVQQFSDDVQLPMLRELDYVFKRTYFTRDSVVRFLDDLVLNDELAGDNPCDFWRGASLLEIQQNGHSQKEMLRLFGEILQQRCGLTLADCTGSSNQYIYLDDALFSGARIGNDLEQWIRADAPQEGDVHIICIATHKLGEWQCDERLKNAAEESGKRLQFHFWRKSVFENRKSYRDSSEVLWPVVLPDHVELSSYMAQEKRFPFEPRRLRRGPSRGIFSSEESRQLLERELLLAGMRIRSFSQNPSRAVRPLGFSAFGLGFGSMIVTFRNCPNNCPLALWWGDPNAAASSPLSRWYPLFPRKTYSQRSR